MSLIGPRTSFAAGQQYFCNRGETTKFVGSRLFGVAARRSRCRNGCCSERAIDVAVLR